MATGSLLELLSWEQWEPPRVDQHSSRANFALRHRSPGVHHLSPEAKACKQPQSEPSCGLVPGHGVWLQSLVILPTLEPAVYLQLPKTINTACVGYL